MKLNKIAALNCCGALMVAFTLSLLFPTQLFGQQAFYTFTSGPSGDGFTWDFDDPPFGLNDLPLDETFLAPTLDGFGFNNIENFSGDVNFFDDAYQAAANSTRISGDAWWGNPDDNNCCGQVGVSFINTPNGAAETVSFDFAWALAGEEVDSVLEVEVFDDDFDSAFLFFDLDSPFNAGPAFGGFDGWEGSIFFNLEDAQSDNFDVDSIAGFNVSLFPVTILGGTGEFAIDNLSINEAGAGNSNVFPYSSFSNAQIGGLATRYLKDSPNDVQVSFEVKNDGTDPTTFSASLDGTSNPAFVPGSPATNAPIDADGVGSTGSVATLRLSNLSGLYEASVTVSNDLNGSDPDESIPYNVTIYDPPQLTDNSASPVQVHNGGSIVIANATAGPHAGAERAGVEVMGTTTTGGFVASGYAVNDFVGPGGTLDGTVNFNRYGRLNGVYNGSLTIDLEMTSTAGSFLNGKEPVPSVVWNLEFDLSTTATDSVAVASSESLGPSKVGVNDAITAATILDGTSSSGQTVSMTLVSNPEQGDASQSAALATSTVDLGFSTGADLFVLQFTYDDGNLPSGFTEEQMQLLVFDDIADNWVIAIDENSDGGSGGSFFAGSYASFLAGPGGGSLDAADLSSFGVDTASNMAWAVLDHASLFSLGVLGMFSSADVDLDNDGDVDGADFLLIQQSDPSLIADWQAQYGSGLGSLSASQVVPEPNSLGLSIVLLVGASLASTNRKLRRR